MKKLNRKGFTLVELLAVIIILAIVVGITIPAVLTTVTNSRVKAGNTAAQVAANWIDDQYTIASVDADSLDGTFKSTCGSNASSCIGKTGDTTLIVPAGMKTNDVEKMDISINTTTGKSCVTIYANSTGGYYKTSGQKFQRYVQGASCSATGYSESEDGTTWSTPTE